MRRFALVGFLIAFVAALGAVFALASDNGVQANAPKTSGAPEDHGFDPAIDKTATWMGVATCASTACHNENGRQGAPRSEYSTWKAVDRHARAFSVLYNERSDNIMHNLYGVPKTVKGSAASKDLCLKCHSSFTGKDQKVGDRFYLAEGVGCESCHGPAEKWLTTHYQAGFKELTLEQKASQGMCPTKDLTFRAKLCASCHVGNADKEVNHDLIAAGHPRLNFELAGFHSIYPRHWLYADERARHADFEARLWTVGQVVSGREAVALLKIRAEEALKDHKPWPEFAEYDCFKCHQRLQLDSPTQQELWTKGPGRSGGTLVWGNWYESTPGLVHGSLRKPLEGLKRAMENAPREQTVLGDVDATLKVYDAWLRQVHDSGPMSIEQVRGLSRTLADQGGRNADALDWDQASQLYLGLVALHRGMGDLKGRTAPLTPEIMALGARLQKAFPPKSDSPTLFNPSARFEDKTLKDQFLDIRNHLGQ